VEIQVNNVCKVLIVTVRKRFFTVEWAWAADTNVTKPTIICRMRRTFYWVSCGFVQDNKLEFKKKKKQVDPRHTKIPRDPTHTRLHKAQGIFLPPFRLCLFVVRVCHSSDYFCVEYKTAP
jgi:hypothetical protein